MALTASINPFTPNKSVQLEWSRRVVTHAPAPHAQLCLLSAPPVLCNLMSVMLEIDSYFGKSAMTEWFDGWEKNLSVIFHHATLVVFNSVWASSQVMLRGGICWVAVTLDLLSLLSDGDHGGQYPSLWFLFSHNHVLFLKGSVLPWKSASKLIRNVKYLRANTVGAELRKYQWGATTDYVKYSMVSHRNVLFAILRMCKCRNVTLLNLISLWLL